MISKVDSDHSSSVQGLKESIFFQDKNSNGENGVKLENILNMLADNVSNDADYMSGITNIDLYELNEGLSSILRGLPFLTYRNEIFNKISDDEIDLSRLSTPGGKLLSNLATFGFRKELFTMLPSSKIDLSNISEGAGLFLSGLAIGDIFARKLFEKISQSNIDLYDLSCGGGIFLSYLISRSEGFAKQLFESIVEKGIDFAKLTASSKPLFEELIAWGYGRNLLDSIPGKSVDLGNINEGTCLFFELLLQREDPSNIFLKIKYSSLDECSSWAGRLLRVFVSNGKHRLLINAVLDDNFKLENINDEVGAFLRSLVSRREEYSEKFWLKIKNMSFDFSRIDSEVGEFLSELVSSEEIEIDFLEKIKGIDLSNISDGVGKLFANLSFFDDKNFLLKKIQNKKIDIADISKGGILFLEKLFENEKNHKTLLKLVDGFSKEGLSSQEVLIGRKELSEQSESIDWPSIDEQIFGMPINFDAIRKIGRGWFSLELSKKGSVSTVHIRIVDGKIKNTVFRTQDIKEEAIRSYEKAAEFLPRNVSASTYQELSEDDHPSGLYLTKGGFIEVYAGPAIRNVNLDNIPETLKKEIIRQKNHILLTLALNNIEHNHSHDGNFNIRFLLEKETDEILSWKHVSFDINEVISMMKKDNAITLTPIVTLRDWDAGKSS